MNIIEEINKCLIDIKIEENIKIKASFIFPEDFIGFKGHFINNPILPGIFIIQIILFLLEKYYKKEVSLKEVKLGKFFIPITCKQKIDVICDILDKDIVKSIIFFKEKKVAKIDLNIE